MQTHTNETQFINDIRAALGIRGNNTESRKKEIFTDPAQPTEEQKALLDTIGARQRKDQMALLERLSKEAAPLNLQVIPMKNEAEVAKAIAQLVADTTPEWGDKKSVVQWDHPMIKKLALESALKDQDVPVYTAAFDGSETTEDQKKVKRDQIREQVIQSYIGVTFADFCLADTATLVMRSRPAEARSVSLLPSIHVAVIKKEQILYSLKELYALLKYDSDTRGEGLPHHMVMISGPSKTADIELVMVHGAHGPRALYLYVITGE
nr:lactate utilization protein [uncultured Desulfobacter sp.]